MAIETTVESEKKPVYTKPGVREPQAVSDINRDNCNTGTVAILNPKRA